MVAGYFFRTKSIANHRDRLQGKLFFIRFLICSWRLPFLLFD